MEAMIKESSNETMFPCKCMKSRESDWLGDITWRDEEGQRSILERFRQERD